MQHLNRAHVDFAVVATPSAVALEGSFASGDAEQDAEQIASIQQQLEDGQEWAWCDVEVRATIGELTARTYLGACSYGSEQDFMVDGYYADLCDEAFAELERLAQSIIDAAK